MLKRKGIVKRVKGVVTGAYKIDEKNAVTAIRRPQDLIDDSEVKRIEDIKAK